MDDMTSCALPARWCIVGRDAAAVLMPMVLSGSATLIKHVTFHLSSDVCQSDMGGVPAGLFRMQQPHAATAAAAAAILPH